MAFESVMTPGETPKIKAENGLVWYAAVVPGVALLLERYAMNRYLGMLVWAIVLIVRPLCCFIDRRILTGKGVEGLGSVYLIFLPTVYLFKRSMVLRQNMVITVVSLICLSYGIIGNGFTVGAFVDDDKVLSSVRASSAGSVSDLAKYGSGMSLDSLLSQAFEEYGYSMVSDGDVRMITASGISAKDGSHAELIFRVVHDGFTCTDFSLETVKKNGCEITGDARKEYLKELFTKSDTKQTDSSAAAS